MAIARGKYAKAISDRSGMEFPYSEMVKEWNGMLVHKSEFEPKHPQLDPISHRVDPEALRDPRPTESAPTIHLGKVIVSNPVDSNGVSSPIMFAGNSNTIGSKFTMTQVTSSLGDVTIVT